MDRMWTQKKGRNRFQMGIDHVVNRASSGQVRERVRRRFRVAPGWRGRFLLWARRLRLRGHVTPMDGGNGKGIEAGKADGANRCSEHGGVGGSAAAGRLIVGLSVERWGGVALPADG